MPRKIEEIPIGSIIVDHTPLTPTTNALVKHLESGGGVPPIKVAKLNGGRYRLKDGRHRVTAYKLLGKSSIRAQFGIPVSEVSISQADGYSDT